MITHSNFRTAVDVLEGLTSLNRVVAQPFQFGEEYNGQHPITTALKILNTATLAGTDTQKTELSSVRHKIIALNTLLGSPSFNTELTDKLGIEMGEEAAKLQGMQIAVPQTKFEKMLEIATVIPRVFFTIILDLLLLPFALILLIIACCKPNFNPKLEDVKQGKTPILLIHGSGANETGWVVGRQFLNKEQYGSVFSMNYDGLVSNDPTKGIDDYAREKISAEVKRIKAITASDNVILMGHSMGGMIAGYYAEHFAEADGVKIDHVISIATPWQGSSTIDSMWQLGGHFSKENETKRHQQMSTCGGTDTDPYFRETLVSKALSSERKGIRKYYNIWSTTDYAVPNMQGNLTEDPRRQRSFNYLGHYALIAWPSVWWQANSWLDEIYATNSAKINNIVKAKNEIATLEKLNKEISAKACKSS